MNQNPEKKPVRAIFVCGPWGSGTSVVTQFLISLGLVGMPPYLKINDPRTPISYESIAFRNTVLSFAQEKSFSLFKEKDFILNELLRFREYLVGLAQRSSIPIDRIPVVLKYPLSCLILEELNEVFDSKFVVVRRSIEEIENGRLRRHWPDYLGAKGAVAAYEKIDSFSKDHKTSVFDLSYRELLIDPVGSCQELVGFCGLNVAEQKLVEMAGRIRR
jgi:hypothetical protein